MRRSALVSILVAAMMLFANTARAETQESAYDRVVRTGTLRCAYMLWPAFMERDPNTGKFSGYNYEEMEAIAASLNIKVEWVAEIPSGTQIDTLKTGKADAICAAEGPVTTGAALYLTYTEPLAYFPFFAYARQDDNRFTGKLDRMNAEDVKIVTIDGDVSGEMVRLQFPKAKPAPLPQMADPSQMMLDVVSKKADVVISDEFSIQPFLKNNPGKLKKVSQDVLVVIPNTFSTLRRDMALNDLISQATRNLRDRGVEKRIQAKYGIGRDVPLYLMAPRYIVPKPEMQKQ